MSTLTAAQIDDLNHMNRIAHNAALGTVIGDMQGASVGGGLTTGSAIIGAGGVATPIDIKGDGKILVGNGTTATSVIVSGDVTLTNTGLVTIGNDKVHQRMMDSKNTYETFDTNPVMVKAQGLGACTGTTGNVNLLRTTYNSFEWHVKGTQTILTPTLVTNGLDISQDLTAADGVEYTQGILSRSRSCFTIGTSPAFYCKARILIPDVSGTAECAFGFRKQEAYTANIDDYNDMAVINTQGTAIRIETILTNAATVTTNTTQTIADGNYIEIMVLVSATGVVTYKLGVDTPAVEAPTQTAAYTFTNALNVIPFFFFLHGADIAESTCLQLWEVGYQ